MKRYAQRIGFLQPQCITWNKKQKIKKIRVLLSKGVNTCIFEDNNVGIYYGNYKENWYRELMIKELALWLHLGGRE